VAKQPSELLSFFFFFFEDIGSGIQIQDFASLQPRASHQEDWMLAAISETGQTHLRARNFPSLCFDLGPHHASSTRPANHASFAYVALKLARQHPEGLALNF
jgi:hypothetical protein